MKTYSRLLRTVELTLLMFLCAIPLASAQSRFVLPGVRSKFFQISDARVQAHIARARRQQLSPQDVSTFQSNLQSLVTYIGQVPTIIPTQQQSAVNDVQNQINSMTPDEMSQMAASADTVAFNTAVTGLFSNTPGTPILPSTDPPSDLVVPQYPSFCTPTMGPPQIPSDPGTMRDLLIVTEVLTALQIVADDLSNLDIEIVGEGANIALVIIATVIDEVVLVLQDISAGFTFCDPDIEAAQVTSNWQNTIVIDTDIANLNFGVDGSFSQIANQVTSIDTDVDSHISSIAGTTSSQYSEINNELVALSSNFSNQVTGLDLDVDNHIASANITLNNSLANLDSDVKSTTTTLGTAIANQIAQVDNDVLNQAALTQAAITGTAGLQTLDTRLQIELAMAQGLNVESFILPNTSGGYLQTVRSIASSIINLMQTDKQTIGTATKWLAQGDTALTNKQYITAYQDYVAAYQAASK